MKNESLDSMRKTKECFEASFEATAFYNKQTQDKEHLELILNALDLNDEMKILDLGTGLGYLAFNIARQYPKVEVTGLDIVEKALEKNRKKASNEGLKNLQFTSYDGLKFPFSDASFDMVVTRYALHHFPSINETFAEISRVLKTNGKLFLSDPAPNDNDTDRFVDTYMQMKKDGHIKFYTKDEWQTIARQIRLKLVKNFETYIRFPKKKETALEFDDIICKFDKNVIEGYSVEVIDDEIWITEKVNNILFIKPEEQQYINQEVEEDDNNEFKGF